tara:strand:- start:155 stop:433 length:279 start_codon:yes stop_codon:yes gene_type:complete
MNDTKKKNYDLMDISMDVNGRLSVMPIKVSPALTTLASGKIVQAICFVKQNGTQGAIQHWTPSYIAQSVEEAKELVAENKRVRAVFAGAQVS